jgi:hypothetical protein
MYLPILMEPFLLKDGKHQPITAAGPFGEAAYSGMTDGIASLRRKFIMMRSMFSGVSGLRAHQTRMDVIGNNVANVNTVGFKSGRVTFQEVFSQTLKVQEHRIQRPEGAVQTYAGWSRSECGIG